jgi:hypothetical protein
MHSLNQRYGLIALLPVTCALVVGVASCNQVSTNSYEAIADFEATAATTYLWQVEYLPRNATQDRPNDRRLERFESTTVVNINGIRPEAAGSGPDEKGLWWPVLPKEPTVNEIEERRQKAEKPRSPEVIKKVDYEITFNRAGDGEAFQGNRTTLPTNYDVYRQAVKAFEKDRPLKLTLGPQDATVLTAEIE